MRPIAVVALVAAGISVAEAQQQEFRWSVWGGPTMAIRNDHTVRNGGPFCSSCGPEGYPISGASRGQLHFGLGLSRPVRKTSLTSRFEMFYTLSESAPETYGYLAYSPVLETRRALRDEVFFVGKSLQWDAVPAGRSSVYLLTTVGIAYNRLGWSRDPASRSVDEQSDVMSGAAGLGGGMRMPLGRHETYVEWRRFWAPVAPGSSIAPFSFGFRW